MRRTHEEFEETHAQLDASPTSVDAQGRQREKAPMRGRIDRTTDQSIQLIGTQP